MKSRAGHIVSFAFQALLILIGLFLAAQAVNGGSYDDKTLMGILMFFLGITQLISGLVTAILMKDYKPQFKAQILVYWALVGAYFMGMFTLVASNMYLSDDFWQTYIGMAWVLALFHFAITIQLAFKSTIHKLIPPYHQPYVG